MADGRLTIFLGTRKGVFLLSGDDGRSEWRVDGPHFFGSSANHVVADPRDGRTVLAAVRTGHLGPTVFRSADGGRTWTEATRPPAFPKAEGGRSVHHVFWLTPGAPSETGTWYAGTSPQGLFRSEDGGRSWEGVAGFNEHPRLADWIGEFGTYTPDGPLLHSVIVDPRDPSHLYVGMSGGGVFESADAGASWRPLNRGVAADFLPVENPETGHDPHRVEMHPLDPDLLWQQNHCGLYRLRRPAETWERVGRNLPAEIGDIGFPVIPHPRDTGTAWVFPMDGTDVWPRTSVGGRPAAYRTRDGGATWERQDAGFPRGQAWFTVLRQAMARDDLDPVGLYVGTTGGEVWASADEGESWREVVRHLPRVFSVETGRLLP